MSKSKIAAKNGQRKPRYPTLDALKVAVRAQCIEHVSRAGIDWSEESQAELEIHTDPTEHNRAEALAGQLRETLESLIAYTQRDGHRKQYPRIRMLEVFAEEVARPMVAKLNPINEPLQRRAIIAADYDRPDLWWWRGQPKGRDLAVLSLLAGSWPDLLNRKVTDWTAVDVIRLEENAVNKWRSKWTSWRKR